MSILTFQNEILEDDNFAEKLFSVLNIKKGYLDKNLSYPIREFQFFSQNDLNNHLNGAMNDFKAQIDDFIANDNLDIKYDDTKIQIEYLSNNFRLIWEYEEKESNIVALKEYFRRHTPEIKYVKETNEISIIFGDLYSIVFDCSSYPSSKRSVLISKAKRRSIIECYNYFKFDLKLIEISSKRI